MIQNPVQVPASLLAVPVLQVTTGASGFALQNGTPTMLTWTAPNDGKLHRATVYGIKVVTVAETGGRVSLTVGASAAITFIAGGDAAGTYVGQAAGGDLPAVSVIVLPNQTITVIQATALTAGASTFYGEIWAS